MRQPIDTRAALACGQRIDILDQHAADPALSYGGRDEKVLQIAIVPCGPAGAVADVMNKPDSVGALPRQRAAHGLRSIEQTCPGQRRSVSRNVDRIEDLIALPQRQPVRMVL